MAAPFTVGPGPGGSSALACGCRLLVQCRLTQPCPRTDTVPRVSLPLLPRSASLVCVPEGAPGVPLSQL